MQWIVARRSDVLYFYVTLLTVLCRRSSELSTNNNFITVTDIYINSLASGFNMEECLNIDILP